RARCGRDAARRRARRTAGAEIAARLVGEAATATTAATAIKHRQRRVEALQHDFGGVFLDTGLVGPFTGLQCTLDVHLGALFQILLGDFAEPLIEDHHAMPFGLFLALAGRLVAPALRGRDAQIGDRPAVLGTPDLRILAEISDQNHLVHTSRHRHSPRLKSPPPRPRLRYIFRERFKRPEFLFSDRPYTLAATLRLAQRRKSPRLSTYSSEIPNVPDLFRSKSLYFLFPKHVLSGWPLRIARPGRIPPRWPTKNAQEIIHFGPLHFPAQCCIWATALPVESAYSHAEFLDRLGRSLLIKARLGTNGSAEKIEAGVGTMKKFLLGVAGLVAAMSMTAPASAADLA